MRDDHGRDVPRAPAVLLVEYDERAADRIGRWLAGDGYTVLPCFGPLAPTFGCPEAHGETCALASLAEVVVLDLALQTDELMDGPAGWEILGWYRAMGKPVVALAGREDVADALVDDGVVVLPRSGGRTELLDAVARVMKFAEPVVLPKTAPTIPFTPVDA